MLYVDLYIVQYIVLQLCGWLFFFSREKRLLEILFSPYQILNRHDLIDIFSDFVYI